MAITLNAARILDTIEMIEKYRLDIRTVTMGISLLDCARPTAQATAEAVYEKVTGKAGRLVEVCEQISKELGVPIVNKRIAVTPISLVTAACAGDPIEVARGLDRAAKAVGVNFIGGYSALV